MSKTTYAKTRREYLDAMKRAKVLRSKAAATRNANAAKAAMLMEVTALAGLVDLRAAYYKVAA